MRLTGLLHLLQEKAAFRQLVAAISPGSEEPVPEPGSAGSALDGAALPEREVLPFPHSALGVITTARPYLVAALYRELGRPILLLTARAERVSQWIDQLAVWTGSNAILPFPEPDALPYERVPWSRETVSDRLTALAALAQSGSPRGGPAPGTAPPLVVASARALMHKTLPVREFRLGLREYRQGQEIDLRQTLERWVAHGYRGETVVEEPGTFSRRGGLVDVFPPNLPQPVRVELFGDEIESLRTFDPTTQRSLDRIDRFVLAPATEALPRLAPLAAQHLAGDGSEGSGLDLRLCHPLAKMEYQHDLVMLENGTYFRGMEFYLALLYSQPSTILDYLPAQGLCIVDDWSALMANVVDMAHQARTLQTDLVAAGELPANLPPAAAPFLDWETVCEGLQDLGSRGPVVLGAGTLQERPGQEPARNGTAAGFHGPVAGLYGRLFSHGQQYGGQLKRVLDATQEMRRAGHQVVLVSRQAQRISELLADGAGAGSSRAAGRSAPEREELASAPAPPAGPSLTAPVLAHLGGGDPDADAPIHGEPVMPVTEVTAPPPSGSLTLVQGTLAAGWILHAKGMDPLDGEPTESGASLERRWGSALYLLTDAEIFGWTRPVPRRTPRRRPVAPEAFFADVEPGSYVVHIEHGIGLFQGLTKMAFDGGEREYLLVEYAAGDKLFVPVYQADRLSRYVGVGEETPHINRLGTAEWSRVKAQAKKAVAEIADDLLALYTAREVVEGHAFSPDTFWQAELEASFPYLETEAQLRALDEIKADMEQRRPMDRLVAGDVGYGKTEVALRAAFKAVMDGKQVAVLVPTTVLAQQHYQTFSERLTSFPVTVKMLSRFLTRKQQEDVVEGLAEGGVDIVIGTHRLLSGDVAFKDLGLLIIDEEQRFGVAHKEQLKQMRQEVDVLTLTATPIPRTLHMSLTGVRDMSTIDTPPEERLPVRTHVGEYDETLIRQAILRELDRGGQVYFVHNRVMGIYQMAQRLRKLIPEAGIAVGHGQMSERELERVMLEFATGNVDVLVCTSIIESGLDIPNANTLIVNRADQFGLAQLYQLRGRVGRAARRAYAYILHPRTASLTETARLRLETIGEATELGAGFRIAMRDLEIRGAGELLGARQHGHIAAVGFDLYTRLLARAVQEAQVQTEVARAGRPALAAAKATAADVLPLEQAVQINLPLAAYLPEPYVPDSALRLQLYRRLARVTGEEEVEDLRLELADRFGPLPEETANLLYQLRLKLHALAAGAKAITMEEGQVTVRADSLENVDRIWLQRRLGDRARVSRRAVWLPLDQDDRWRTALVAVLQAITEGLG